MRTALLALVAWTAVVSAPSSGSAALDQNGGLAGYRAVDRSFRKTGNSITYRWVHQPRHGLARTLEVGLTFHRGYDAMQAAYRRKDHRITNRWEKKFVYGDPFANDLAVAAGALRDEARRHGLSEIEVALTFVQSFPHAQDMGTYQRYAVETLIDRRGDCSDKAALLAGLFTSLGYDYVWVQLPAGPGRDAHLAIAVWMVPNHPGTYYVSRGRTYFYCETNTDVLMPVGEAPAWVRRTPASLRHPAY